MVSTMCQPFMVIKSQVEERNHGLETHEWEANLWNERKERLQACDDKNLWVAVNYNKFRGFMDEILEKLNSFV